MWQIYEYTIYQIKIVETKLYTDKLKEMHCWYVPLWPLQFKLYNESKVMERLQSRAHISIGNVLVE